MMTINTSKDVDGGVAKSIRQGTKLAQKAFWEGLGISQPAGCQYETQQRSIPEPIKQLLFIRYVAGLNYDPTTAEDAERLRNIGKAVNFNN